MNKTNKQKSHQSTEKELENKLQEAIQKLKKLKLDLKVNQLKDTSQIKKTKYQIKRFRNSTALKTLTL